jgi:hypothetical protein
MTRYSFTKYRFVDIIVAANECGVFYEIPKVVDRHGKPYVANRLSQVKQIITRVLHGNSKSYRLSTK